MPWGQQKRSRGRPGCCRRKGKEEPWPKPRTSLLGARGAQDQELIMLVPKSRAGPGLRAASLRPRHKLLDDAMAAKDLADRGIAAPAEEAGFDVVLGVQDLFIVPGPEPDGDRRAWSGHAGELRQHRFDITGRNVQQRAH